MPLSLFSKENTAKPCSVNQLSATPQGPLNWTSLQGPEVKRCREPFLLPLTSKSQCTTKEVSAVPALEWSLLLNKHQRMARILSTTALVYNEGRNQRLKNHDKLSTLQFCPLCMSAKGPFVCLSVWCFCSLPKPSATKIMSARNGQDISNGRGEDASQLVVTGFAPNVEGDGRSFGRWSPFSTKHEPLCSYGEFDV